MKKSLNNKFLLAAVLCTIFSIAAPYNSDAGVVVRGTRVSIEKPAGFDDSPTFSGFQQPSSGSSVMVTELPAPFASLTAGFNKTTLATRDMELLSSEKTSVGSMPALLIQVKQTALGTVYRKWILAFGEQNLSVIVTATFPEQSAAQLSDLMKATVLSSTYSETARAADPKADLPFSLTVTGLRFTNRIQNMLMYTQTGNLRADNKGTVFIVGQSLVNMPFSDQANVARKRLGQIAEVTNLRILSDDEVTIADLPGREIVATGIDTRKKEPMFIYQTMLFPAQSYYLMQGLTPLSTRATYEPLFKQSARTFRVK